MKKPPKKLIHPQRVSVVSYFNQGDDIYTRETRVYERNETPGRFNAMTTLVRRVVHGTYVVVKRGKRYTAVYYSPTDFKPIYLKRINSSELPRIYPPRKTISRSDVSCSFNSRSRR